MDQTYVYEEETEENGLTLKKVGRFFKRGWVTMLVCVVAAVLIAAAVVFPIKLLYKTEQIARTSIEYIYKGIEEGKDPNGGTFNSDNIISTTVLSKAVADAELDSVITDISSLRERMRIESVETEEYIKLVNDAANGVQSAIDRLRTYVMRPTRFVIVISKPSALGLSDTQAKILLDKVVSSYYEDFKSRFAVTNMFPTGAFGLSDNELMEYADIYDEYIDTIKPVADYLLTMSDEAGDFVSTKYNTTFAQLATDLGRIESNLGLLNRTILSNNVWKNKPAALGALTESKSNLTTLIDNTDEYIRSLTDQIDKFKPNTTSVTSPDGGQTTTNTYSEYYTELQKTLNNYNLLKLDYQTQLANITARITALGNETVASAEAIRSVENLIAAIESSATELYEKVNNVIADYYDTTFVSSAVRQVQPSVVTRKSSNINMIVAFGLAAFVGFAAACIITTVFAVKANRAEAAKKEAAEKAEAEKTAAVADDGGSAEKESKNKK